MRTDHCQRFVIIAACAAMMAGCALKTPPDTRSLTETEVRYSDGTKEEIENGRYERKDANGRTVEERPATAADIARLSGL